jgi:hypothetical protein
MLGVALGGWLTTSLAWRAARRGWRRAIDRQGEMVEEFKVTTDEVFRAWRRSQNGLLAATQRMVDEVVDGPDEDDPRTAGG